MIDCAFGQYFTLPLYLMPFDSFI